MADGLAACIPSRSVLGGGAGEPVDHGGADPLGWWRHGEDPGQVQGVGLAQRPVEDAGVLLRGGRGTQPHVPGGRRDVRKGQHAGGRVIRRSCREALRVDEADAGPRGVVRGEGAGRADGRGGSHRQAGDGLDVRLADVAGTQDDRALARAVDDRRLDADAAGPAVEDDVVGLEELAELADHVRGRRGADPPEPVGARCRDADRRVPREPGQLAEHLQHDRVRRDPDRDRVLPAGHEVGGARRAGQDEGQGAGPERVGEGRRVGGHRGGPVRGGAGVPHVDDERVVRGPALGGVDPGDGVRQVGTAAEAVDRLGGQRHEVPGGQRGCRGKGVGGGPHHAIQPRRARRIDGPTGRRRSQLLGECQDFRESVFGRNGSTCGSVIPPENRMRAPGRAPPHEEDVVSTPTPMGPGSGPIVYPEYRPQGPYAPLPPLDRSADLPPRPRKSGSGAGKVIALLAAAGLIAVTAGTIGGGVGYLVARETLPTTAVTATTVEGVAALPSTVPGSIAEIAARVQPAVVQLNVSGADGDGTGSGFVISEDGYIITNNHVAGVAGQGGSIEVAFSDGSTATGTLVGANPGYDIAVVKVQRTGHAHRAARLVRRAGRGRLRHRRRLAAGPRRHRDHRHRQCPEPPGDRRRPG